MNFKKIKIDKTLLVLILILSIISLLSIHSASTYLSKTLGNLALKQFFWYLVGIVIIFFIFKFKLNFIMKISPYLYLLNVLLLLGLLFIAPEINGSKCWYVLDGVGSFQPSEFMKITLLLFEVYIVNKFNKKLIRSVDEGTESPGDVPRGNKIMLFLFIILCYNVP